MIKTNIPSRKTGQKNVLQLTALPIPIVRIAFIGLGVRGCRAINRIINIPGVEIVALCDIYEESVKMVNQILSSNNLPKAIELYGDTEIWSKATSLPNVDLIYVATDWQNHAKIGVQAMKDNKHVAIEVPAAMNLDEIWELINTSEQTRKHCIQLENCIYDFFELATLNMAQQGLFGEIIHAEGAYIHCLHQFWNNPENNWRINYNEKHRGDLYPTHGIGPVCQALNIHRGDKMNYLVSLDTKAVANPMFIKETTGRNVTNFRNGDHTMTMIRTENEKTIQIQHNISSPRPYNRMYQLTGTNGFVNKYPTEGFAFKYVDKIAKIIGGNKNLVPFEFIPKRASKALLQKYKHPIINGIEKKAKQIDDRGGMNFIMDYRLIYCLQRGLPLDMDVYDLAEWCCLIPLTEISLDNNSNPVEIPDFTRGNWNNIKGLNFAQ